jgi:pimeloyl-ACP methyl ester carboxylesterase
MPYANSGPVRLYYETTGEGYPVLFIHEFAGDHTSWEQQVRYLSRRYTCVTYNARGYPPSDVPESGDAYSQQKAVDDAAAVLRHLGVKRAHIVGLSMGGFCTVHFGMQHAAMARSLVVAGCGYGSPPHQHDEFARMSREYGERLAKDGMAKFAPEYSQSPSRQTLKRKNPRGFDEYLKSFAVHSTLGSAMHFRHVQGARPSLWDFESQLKRLPMPVLVINGDTDEACLETGHWLKRTLPDCGHWIMPWTGHAMNLEEPEAFNLGVERFLAAAEARSAA